jgi:hypothetical protein
MQAGFPQLFTFFVVLVSFLEGCGDSPRARLVLTVNPGNTTGIGETITIDASQSSYDSIEWKIGTAIYGSCGSLSSCQFTSNTATSMNIHVEVEMERRPHWSGLQTHASTSDSAIVPLSWTN